MKIKRQKTAYKILNFYKNTYGIDSPYKVLVDGTFCKACLSAKVNIMEQLPKYLDSDMTLMTTSCVLAECKAFGSLLFGPLKVLSQYTIRPCKHKEPVPAAQCLYSLIKQGNKKKYFVATQDPELSKKSRDIKGVPLLYLAFKNIILERPSNTSKGIENPQVSQAQSLDHQLKIVQDLKRKLLREEVEPKEKKKKRFIKRKPMKKRKEGGKNVPKSDGGVKRKRKNKIKIASHVKAEWRKH
ncbi:rRNA-processing protein UTP23 homolog [Patella vulgata]|uniref:rRNA-processing protein UTP23 homolog n=1 Tax=Patella vulgata TaxID=6465 RepID=UPI00217F8FC9|nr:rRNA-processing protein UTP23 homolog [Patella vulgata]XP_050403781.1 rRNA-processing protein UTP23 homolog [Patella vulgata]